MDSAVAYLGHVPFLLPLVGLTMVVGVAAIVAALAAVILILVWADFRVAVGATQTSFFVVLYAPAISQVSAESSAILGATKDVFTSFASLGAADIIKLVVILAAAGLSLGYLYFHDDVGEAVMAGYTSPTFSTIRRAVLDIANLGAFAVGSGISAYNAVASLEWMRYGILQKVAVSCAISSVTDSLDELIKTIALMIRAVFEDGIYGFLDSPSLLTARLNVVPLLGHVGDLAQLVTRFLDCGCGYLQFVYKEPLEWLQYPDLHIGIDHAVNGAIRIVQAVFITVSTLKFPQLAEAVIEFRPAGFALSDAAFHLVLIVLNVAKDIVNLVPFTSSADGLGPRVTLGAVLGAVATKQTGPVTSYTLAADPLSIDANTFLGIDLLIDIVSAPLPDILGNAIATALGLVNGTWSLTLLITDATLSYDDIRFFQVRHIMDDLRATLTAIGSVGGVVHPDLTPVIGDIGRLAATIVQIATELIVAAIFYNAYQLPPGGDPFRFAVDYCAAPDSGTAYNYQTLYNHSAAIARLFGCDPLEGLYPLESPAATCEISSPLGCITMSTYRLLVEVQETLLRTVCYFSELVRFENDANIKNFGDIPLDGIFRQLTHFASCSRAVIALLDVQSMGVPAGEECIWIDGDDVTHYKISFACRLGDLVQAGIMIFVPAVYEMIKLMQILLASFAMPSYTVQIALPTLANTRRNLEVALCRAGGLLATFLPVTFSCSAQGGTPGSTPKSVRAPLKPWGKPVDLPWSPQQVNRTAFCAFAPEDWVGDLLTPCDCSDTTLYGETDFTVPLLANPGCALECFLPTVFEWPLRIGTGADVDVGYTPYPYYMSVNFTTPAALRNFLQTTHNPLHAMTTIPYGPIATHVDPEPDDPALNGGEWLAELVAAKVNWRVQSTFGLPLQQYVFNFMRSNGPSGCYNTMNNWYKNSTLELPDLEGSNQTCFVLADVNCSEVNCSEIVDYNYTEVDCAVTNCSALDCLDPDTGNSTSLDDIIPNTNGTLAPVVTNFSTALATMFVGDVIDVIEFFAYGSYVSTIVPGARDAIERVFAQGTNTRLLAEAIYWLFDNVHYRNANAIATWRLIISPLVAYNRAFRSCDNAAVPILGSLSRHCFQSNTNTYRQATPTGRPAAVPVPEEFLTTTLATFAPANTTAGMPAFVRPQAEIDACDCAGNATFEHYAAGRGHCLLACDPIAFPQFFGSRPTDCYLPGGCAIVMASLPIDNVTAARQVLSIPLTKTPVARYAFTTLLAMTNPFIQEHPILQMLGGFAPRLLAASLNVYYMRRYSPGVHVYVRTADDPLYTRECIQDDADRNMWGGLNIASAVIVLNRTFFGDGRNMTCEAMYRPSDPSYSVCSRIRTRFPPRYGNAWGTYARVNVAPLLDLINRFRPAGSAAGGHECFVTSEFDAGSIGSSLSGSRFVPGPPGLPTLDLTVPQYDALPSLNVKDLPKCSDMVSCVERTTCSIGRVGIVAADIPCSILEETNKAIQTGSGTWTMGRGFWELLKNVFGKISTRAFATILASVSMLDCVMCAVGGNIPGNILCTAPMYTLFRDILVLLDDVVVTVVNFAVDLLNNVVHIFYYFFSGQLWKLVETLINIFVSLFVDLIIPLLKGLFGFALGAICFCGVWNTFGSSVMRCNNLGWCGKRRAALDADAPEVLAEANATHYYELFAADWPSSSASYTWPAPDKCGPTMAQLAHVSVLSESEGEVASYCLAKHVLFAEAIARPYHRPEGANIIRPPDTCGRTIRLMDAMPDKILTDFDIATQGAVLECIWAASVARLARLQARDDTLAWLPDNFASPLAWVDIAGIAIDGVTAQREYHRDQVYSDAIVSSPEYQEAARAAYGDARVALIQERVTTGSPAPIEAYAQLVATGEHGYHGRKRTLDERSEARVLRIGSMARFVDNVQRAFHEGVIDAVVDEVDKHMATLPPLFATVGGSTAGWTTTSEGMMDDAAVAYEGSEAQLDAAVETAGARLVHSGWELFRHLYKGSPTAARDDEMRRKRRALDDTAETVPSLATLVSNSTKNLLGVFYEMWTGAAKANATGAMTIAGTNATHAPTRVKWELTAHEDARTASAKAKLPPGFDMYEVTRVRAERIIGKTFMEALTDRWTPLGDFLTAARAAPTPHAAQRAARIQMISQAGSQLYEDVSLILAGHKPTVAFEAECPDWFELCLECELLGAYYRMFVSIVMTVYEFYMNFTPRSESTLDHNINAYMANRAYLADPNSPAILGDSPANSPHFPPLQGRIAAYVGDNIQNKLRVNDVEQLVTDTANYVWDALGSASDDLDSFDTFVGISASSAAAEDYDVCSLDKSCRRPRPLGQGTPTYEKIVLGEARRAIRYGLSFMPERNVTPGGIGIAAEPLSLSEIAEGWYDFLFGFVGSCTRVSEFDGSKVRFSLAEALLIVGAGIGAIVVVGLVFPALGDLIFGLVGASLAMTITLLVVAISAGWSASCFPAFPPILFTSQIMQFLMYVAAPQCPLPYSGLVKNPAGYTNANCMDHQMWLNGGHDLNHCGRDLGWTSILDLPVFLVRVFWPSLLSALATPEDLPIPFSLFFSIEIVHEWLTRWDAVDVEHDQETYAGHWQCAAWIMPIPWLIIIMAAATIAQFGPTMAALNFIFALALALIRCLGAFVIAFFGAMFIIMMAPATIMAAVHTQMEKDAMRGGDDDDD